MTSPNLEFIAVKDFDFSPAAAEAWPTRRRPRRTGRSAARTTKRSTATSSSPSTRRSRPPANAGTTWKFFLEWGKRIKPEDWPWENEKEMVLWRLKEFYGFDLTWDEFQAVPVRSTEPGGQAGEPVYKKYEKGMLRPDGQPGFPTTTGRIEFFCPTMQAFGYDPLPDYTEPAESPISQPRPRSTRSS